MPSRPLKIFRPFRRDKIAMIIDEIPVKTPTIVPASKLLVFNDSESCGIADRTASTITERKAEKFVKIETYLKILLIGGMFDFS